MAKFDIYEAVTDRIISELEKGVIPWERPWTGVQDGAVSHVSGKPYSFLNQMLLGKPGEWLTFNQCKAEGGNVRKGAKARMVVFWKPNFREEQDAKTGETIVKNFPLLRYYNVFHIDDCEGIKPRLKAEELPRTAEPIEAAEAVKADYLSRSGVKLIHEEGNRAFYRPATDSITLPVMEQFREAAEYYSTAFHEMIHSTGHKSRLNRITSPAAFGSEEYSKEELVAEIGAAALCNSIGIETASSFRNSAAYIQSWLKALKDDKKLIVSASSKAEKAFHLVMGEQSPEAEGAEA